MTNFIKLFWHNLCHYRHIALSFNSGHAARVVNYTEKSFMKLTPVTNYGKVVYLELS